MNFSLVFFSRLQLSFQSGSVEDEKSGKWEFLLSRQMTRPWHWTDASVQRNGEGEVAVETARPGYDMMRVISESGLKYLGSQSLHHCAYFELKLMNSRCYTIHKRSCWLKAKLKQRTKNKIHVPRPIVIISTESSPKNALNYAPFGTMGKQWRCDINCKVRHHRAARAFSIQNSRKKNKSIATTKLQIPPFIYIYTILCV